MARKLIPYGPMVRSYLCRTLDRKIFLKNYNFSKYETGIQPPQIAEIKAVVDC
jgi:hypothetical protein